MNLADLGQVKALVETLDRIDKALDQMEEHRLHQEDKDSNNFWGQFSQFTDGSAEVVNLIGCYVFDDVVDCIENVLHTKRLRVIVELENFGVNTASKSKRENSK